MHTPEKAKCPALMLIEVLLSFLKIKQGDNEDLLDYLPQFKSERDIVKRLFRNKLIDGYIEGLPEYTAAVDDAARQDVKSRELDKFLAVLFLRNANHERFGDLLFEYRKEFANNEEKYPKDLKTMMDVMRQQTIKKEKSKSSSAFANGDKDKGKNKEADQGATSFAQVDDSGKEEGDGGYVCFCCGSSNVGYTDA